MTTNQPLPKNLKNGMILSAIVTLLGSLGYIIIPPEEVSSEPRACEAIAQEGVDNYVKGFIAERDGDLDTVTKMQAANSIIADEFIAAGCKDKSTPWADCKDDITCRQALIQNCMDTGTAEDYATCKELLKNAKPI